METTKENQNPNTVLLPVRMPEDCTARALPQIMTQGSASHCGHAEDKHCLAVNDSLVKTETTEKSNEILDELEEFPSNSSILSNVCNMAFPVSSTSARIAEMIKADTFLASQFEPKGKRRFKNSGIVVANNVEQTHVTNGIPDIENDGMQYGENKQSEVLKAAKSLFSKRTRTLYHWMYPNASKQQLKLAITNSWETLSTEEKEFYISQVLGRFGFPQRSLMVNPQLGCIKSMTTLSTLPVNSNTQTSDETQNAVSSILLNDNKNVPRAQSGMDNTSYGNGKKRKLHRHQSTRKSKSRRNDPTKLAHDLVSTDEFQDDPELNREFQQFKWTLRMTDETN